MRRWPAALAISLLAVAMTPVRAGATGGMPSSIGNEVVRGIAVSPLYEQTGLVVAMAVAVVCPQGSSDCVHLWRSRDGGHTWGRAAARGWEQGIPQVAVGAGGREQLVAPGTKGVQVSDDAGDSWRDVGPSGAPVALPTYARDGAIAVAGGTGPDHLLRNGGSTAVRGSGGSLADMSFAFAPTYPQAGQRSPALLSGVDTRTSQYVVDRCNAALSCDRPTLLGSASAMGGTVQLQLSSDYAADGTVFASAMMLGVSKSIDGGGTFTARPLGTPGASVTEVTGLAVSPSYREAGPDRRVVAAVMQLVSNGNQRTTTGGVYESADGATTWKALGTPGVFDHGASAVAMAPDGRIFAGYIADGGDAGLMCTVGGVAWEASCPAVGSGHAPSGGTAPGGSATCAGSACAGAHADSPVVPGGGGGAASAGGAAAMQPKSQPAGAALPPSSGSGALSRVRWMVLAPALIPVALGAAAMLRRRRLRGGDTGAETR